MSGIDIVTPEHPRWGEFMDELLGPKGCNFVNRGDDVNEKWTWTCKGGNKHPIARRILKRMGADVEASLDYFDEHGGHCDCEIVWNVDWGDES